MHVVQSVLRLIELFKEFLGIANLCIEVTLNALVTLLKGEDWCLSFGDFAVYFLWYDIRTRKGRGRHKLAYFRLRDIVSNFSFHSFDFFFKPLFFLNFT